MKYYAPYGSSDPDAPYVDRSSPDAQQGSKVPARAIEHPQREIVKVITEAGLTPDQDDTGQLWAALKFFFLQFPIYPECTTSNGKFDVSQPSTGTIRVPAGVTWTMRGARSFETETAVNLTTLANKTYHLRWTEALGFHLKDLTDTGYNSSGLTSDDTLPAFDSSYDNMLIAKIVTDGSNVATIVNLVNRANLLRQVERRDVLDPALYWATLTGSGTNLNWARTPQVVYFAMNEWRSNNTGPTPGGPAMPENAGIARAIGGRVPAANRTRYAIPALEYYYEDTESNFGLASWTLLIQAFSTGAS